jgi:hypothetical protein
MTLLRSLSQGPAGWMMDTAPNPAVLTAKYIDAALSLIVILAAANHPSGLLANP